VGGSDGSIGVYLLLRPNRAVERFVCAQCRCRQRERERERERERDSCSVLRSAGVTQVPARYAGEDLHRGIHQLARAMVPFHIKPWQTQSILTEATGSGASRSGGDQRGACTCERRRRSAASAGTEPPQHRCLSAPPSVFTQGEGTLPLQYAKNCTRNVLGNSTEKCQFS